jgi:ADP-ribose pyrophosphatase YjhB (NUDIX family)
MSGEKIICPHCGKTTDKYLTPAPTVDIIIETGEGIVLIKRRNPPYGWAIPGGFVDYGENVEHAALREAKEETGLDVSLTRLLGVYSDPARDPRFHTISTVFIGTAEGMPVGHDDAEEARVFSPDNLPEPLAFDHARILAYYCAQKAACTSQDALPSFLNSK